MKKIDYDFIENISMLGKMRVNPAKDSLAFVRSLPNIKKNVYDSNLWLYTDGFFTCLTVDDKVENFVWEGNEHILFSAVRSEDDKEKQKAGSPFTSFYRLPIRGGEARPAFSLPLNILTIEPLGYNFYLLLAEFDRKLPNAYVLDEEKRKELAEKDKKESFYTRLTEIPFYFNGSDYTEGKRKGLFLYNARLDEIERISKEDLDVDFYSLSEDKRRLYFAGSSWSNKASLYSGLYFTEFILETDPRALEMPLLQCEELYPEKDYSFSYIWETEPEKKRASQVFVLASDMHEFGRNESAKIYLLDKENNELVLQNEKSFESYSCLNTDVSLGADPSHFVYQGEYYFVATDRDHDSLYKISKDASVNEVYASNGAILAVQKYQNGFLFSGMEDMLPGEIFALEEVEDRYQSRVLSKFNRPLFSDYELLHPVEIASGDEVEIDGWIIYPSGFEKNKKYPAILDIHGGPRTAYGPVFFHEMQVWAQKGYFVLFSNPRGSGGRGDAFADIRGKYGRVDYEDLMKFLDACLEAVPEIDKNRLGVTGGSYGGFMSNWIIGHTDRFKACATQRSISNWISFYGTADIGFYFACDQMATKTWDQAGFLKLWDYSPLRYINSCKTPTLIIHSAKDYRCPLEQGYQLFTALKDRDVESELLLFHEETHELSRSGKPQARLVRLRAITEWMDRFLADYGEAGKDGSDLLEKKGYTAEGICEVYDGETLLFKEEVPEKIEEK